MPGDEDAPGVSIAAQISLGLAGLTSELKRRNDHLDLLRRRGSVPTDYMLRGSGVCPGTTFAFMVGNPQQGRIGILRRLVIGGVQWGTAATGTAVAIVSATTPTTNTVDTTSVVGYASSLPLIGYYSAKQVVIRPPDMLWVVILGGTNGQQYVASAQLEEYEEGAYTPEIVL